VKGRTYALSQLLGEQLAAEPYIGGSYAVLYLSPRDYHRVHTPAAATVTALAPYDGASYPVNALGVRRIEGLFVKNKRLVFGLHTNDFGTLGLVMVGATNVGRITTSLVRGARVERGTELGVFNLGSTVVLVCPRASGLAVLPTLHEGETIRLGSALLERR
jgi:phosphatidylserine decarboxylase